MSAISTISIICGPPQKASYNGRSNGYAREQGGYERVNTLKSETGYRPSVAVQRAPIGSWGKKLVVTDGSTVKHVCYSSLCNYHVSPPKAQSCAYCHDEESIHHIKNCPVLHAKNKKQAESNLARKQHHKEQQYFAAEARIAEQVRVNQVEESVKYSFLDAAIASGKVATRKVSFKDDSKNLMKPPCETKVFDKDDAPSQISSDDEEVILESSPTAWKPKRLRNMNDSINAEILVLETELASFTKGCWADDCEIEELEDDIKILKSTLQ